ncbi:MAG: hypothetical protein ACJ8FN_12935 [Sphingomicrobium sp.]
MKAGLRFTRILLTGGLCFSPLPALAQETTQPASTSAPATNAVGPRELQDFSLPGTTKPADQPAAAPTAAAQAPQASSASDETAVPSTPSRRVPQSRRQSVATIAAAPEPIEAAPNRAAEEVPPLVSASGAGPSAAVAFSPPAISQPQAPTGTLASEHKLSIWPWLLAALALAGGTLFLVLRRRPREAFAGVPRADFFQAPEPEPAPQPRPAPSAARPLPEAAPAPEPRAEPAPRPSGRIVSSRLRPSLEIAVQPLRCVITDDQVAIEFEIELFNSGAAPARAVLAEASLFNAGADQEQVLQAFFANPVGKGDRLEIIPALRHLTLTSKVVAPRDAIQEYDLGGHRSFVPVLAFNALYEWSGGKGQTSAAYLVGRDTGSDKLGPLRLDARSREIRDLGALGLPAVLKT